MNIYADLCFCDVDIALGSFRLGLDGCCLVNNTAMRLFQMIVNFIFVQWRIQRGDEGDASPHRHIGSLFHVKSQNVILC